MAEENTATETKTPEQKFGWGPRAENKHIGKEIQRIDALPKLVGKAKYSADYNTKGTLYAKLLTSPYARAKVKSLDVSAAKSSPGVHSVHVFNDAGAEIRWEGMLIVAVAAERPEYADDALSAIKIEYEVLEHHVNEEDLAKAEAAKRTKALGKNNKGNPDEAFGKADVVVEGYYGAHTISHMCLEPHGSHCEWNGDQLLAHLSTQNVSGTPGQFAGPLGIDAANVTVECAYEGGGFGSKFAADEWGVACAMMAKEAGRPVRLMLDRATDLKVAGVRPSGFAKVKVGADKTGKILAWESEHWGTPGPGSGAIPTNGIPYVFDFDNRRRSATNIACDTGPSRAWRAPPHPQQCVMTECIIDDVAAKLGLDSYEVFKTNLDATGELKEKYLAEMEIAAKLIDWKGKWHPHGKDPAKGPVKRGLGLALHTWGGGAGPAQCQLKVHPDGSVETFLGSQDIGTGTRTVITIVIAETFGLPLDAVKVNLGSSKYPACAGSGGSITVGGVGGANRRAAQTALWKIFDLVAGKFNVPADKLSAKDAAIWNGADKVCTWKQAAALVGPMPLEVKGEGPADDGLTSAKVGGVQMADVSVDTETGIVRINKFVAVQDCGLIIDELTARSQMYGGIIMGISYALTEERIMDDKTGRYINSDLANYKLPRLGDIGEIVVEMYQPDSEYDRGIVGLGEPPVISPGAAISNAVCNAIGVRVPVLPLTPQRVLEALKGGAA